MFLPLLILSSSTVAFVDVTVVPMDRDRVLAAQTVIVDAGRIVALGPTANVAVPADAVRVEGRGRYLMPGLADMHVHTWDKSDLLLFAANGVTTVRNMFGSPMHVRWNEEARTSEVLAPWVYTAGPIIDGSPPVWPGSAVLTDPAGASELVREQKAAGYDFIKVYSKLEGPVYDAIVAAAGEQEMRVMGHVPNVLDLSHVIAAGQDSIEHLDGFAEAAQKTGSPYSGEVSFMNESAAWKHVDDEKLAALARACVEHDVWNCPTLVVMEKWVLGDEATRTLARPEMKYVAPFMRWFWKPDNNYLKGLPKTLVDGVRAAHVDRVRAVRTLHAAKARILLGTDTGNPFVVPGFAVHEELAYLVQAGLSPYEALRAGTSGAAEFMRAGEEWGTVAVGRRADLVLLEKNPLDDVRHATARAGVMVRGKWYPEDVLRAQLEEQAARFAAQAPDAPSAPANK